MQPQATDVVEQSGQSLDGHLVSDETTNLYNVALHLVLQDLQRLHGMYVILSVPSLKWEGALEAVWMATLFLSVIPVWPSSAQEQLTGMRLP